MSWGIDGPYSLPDGTTWDGITGREWESHGGSMNWSGFNYEFHLYYDAHPWSPISWTEDTGVEIESFSLKRGVKSWWEGMTAGGGTIVLSNESRAAWLSGNWARASRIRLTVDVPGGEKDLFTGFILDKVETFDSAQYSRLLIIVQDQYGYTGQSAFTARTSGAQTTGWMLDDLLQNFGAGVVAADVAGIATGSGLTQNGTIAAGNLVDKLNQYLRGELGMMWVDASGVFQFSPRDWWAPRPDPIATIGSLDRGSGGTRIDPSWNEHGYLFPGSYTTSKGPIGYNKFKWFHNGVGGSATNDSSDSRVGIRAKTDTTEINTAADASNGVSFLATVEANYLWDTDLTVRFIPGYSVAAMDYAAVADVGDFVEAALETQRRFRRDWSVAWVMEVQHQFDPNSGWVTTLRTDTNLALYNFAVPT